MKISIKKWLLTGLALLMIFSLIPIGVSAQEIIVAANEVTCNYQTHVENIGWQELKSDGDMSGTSGMALRLEGIKINLDTQGYDLGVSYQTHIQNIGWEAETESGWKSNGAMSGTEGMSYRLEAIQIKLTGADADQFDLYYQVHAQNMGWLGWAKNGESAGTEGFSYRLEAIKIVVVAKDDPAPGTTERSFVENISCNYQTHIENIGWQEIKSDGDLSGTSGESLRLEGIKIDLDTKGYDLGVSYQTHIQNIGWEADTERGWKSNGEMSGTEGLRYRLEAIQIKLTGADAEQFDLYYQVHAQNMGWLGWAKNGESAGTAGYGYRLEGIRIVSVQKGANPPTGTVDQNKPFTERKSIEGNLLIHSTSSDFNDNANALDNVEISNNIGDGAIVLKSGALNGVYTSNVYNTSSFNKLVISWDSDTPQGTLIQVEARVSENIVDSNGQSLEKWSNWLSWGQWGTFINRASRTGVTDGPVAYVDVDTLVVKDGKTANKIQYRVILNSNTSGVTPSVRLISEALRNTIPGQGINKVFTDNPDLSNLNVLNVPQLSQMVRDPSIADSICSPTSVAMVLNYYGTPIQPEQAAWGAYDYGYRDFGNWPFNTAYAASAASQDYRAYVDYSTIDGLKREIVAGHPVVVAVAYKNSANVYGNLPVVDGAPIQSTFGHLIVVCGFTNENGTNYIIINDPAASNDAGVRVKYKLDQFEKAWAESGNIAYIIHKGE